MFDGEHVIIDQEKISRDHAFLLWNGALPWPNHSYEIPIIHRKTTTTDVLKIADTIYEQVEAHLDHAHNVAVRYPYRPAWQHVHSLSQTRKIIHELCLEQHSQIKNFDISMEMFGLRTNVHRPLPWSSQSLWHSLIDISYGMTTRLGDGQRSYIGNGQWGFNQMKGLRVHTGHMYFRG